jgi:hypothetical protein
MGGGFHMATSNLFTTQILERMEQFKPIWTDIIVQQQGEFAKLLEAMSAPHFRVFSLSDEALNACEELAVRGWTVQMELSFPDMVDLAAMSVDEMDAFFVNYHTEHEFAALRRVRAELAGRPHHSRRVVFLLSERTPFRRENHFPAILEQVTKVSALCDCRR